MCAEKYKKYAKLSSYSFLFHLLVFCTQNVLYYREKVHRLAELLSAVSHWYCSKEHLMNPCGEIHPLHLTHPNYSEVVGSQCSEQGQDKSFRLVSWSNSKAHILWWSVY